MIRTLLTALMTAATALLPSTPAIPSYLPLEWHLTTIGAPQAWAQGADGHGVHVLVIDTGESTATLTGTVTLLPGFTYNNAYPDNLDADGHGTFTVSEVAGHGPYWGVAPKASVAMAQVVTTANGATDAAVAAAIRWGATRRFPVESISLGNPIDDPGVRAAVAFAERLGTVIVAAAGNDSGYGVNYPAAYPGVLCVAATDPWDQPASFTTENEFVSLAAPGAWVFGLLPNRENSIQGRGLATLPGTSMSAPLVAGAVADLISVGLSPQQAKEAVLAGARTVPNDEPQAYGHGILWLPGALHYARERHWL